MTPKGQFNPLYGELRPSEASAERLLSNGVSDQRRPLYEVLEVELLRSDALGSSTHKTEGAKAPNPEDGTEAGNVSQGGRVDRGPDEMLRPTGNKGDLLKGGAPEETKAEQTTSPQILGPGPASQAEGKGNNDQSQETTLLKRELQEGTCSQPCQIGHRKDLCEAEIQAHHRQGERTTAPLHQRQAPVILELPGTPVVGQQALPPPRGAVDHRGAMQSGPLPEETAKKPPVCEGCGAVPQKQEHPVLSGEGQGPDDVDRPMGQTEADGQGQDLFEGKGGEGTQQTNATSGRGPDGVLRPRRDSGAGLIDGGGGEQGTNEFPNGASCPTRPPQEKLLEVDRTRQQPTG